MKDTTPAWAVEALIRDEEKNENRKRTKGKKWRAGIQSRYGKSKGEPDNGCKHGEVHEPSNDRV